MINIVAIQFFLGKLRVVPSILTHEVNFPKSKALYYSPGRQWSIWCWHWWKESSGIFVPNSSCASISWSISPWTLSMAPVNKLGARTGQRRSRQKTRKASNSCTRWFLVVLPWLKLMHMWWAYQHKSWHIYIVQRDYTTILLHIITSYTTNIYKLYQITYY